MATSAASGYPVTFTFEAPEGVANWRPLVQWLLAIPHWVVLYLLRIVSQVLAVVSWFVILFTGRMPPTIATFQAMYLRYNLRATTYALFLREEYPPFGFDTSDADPGDDPRVRLDFTPDIDDRNRLTTLVRFIMVIPHAIVLAFVGVAAAVAIVVGFFAVLFTGRWPDGLRDFVVGVLRWTTRVEAYLLLLTDEYPPFSTT